MAKKKNQSDGGTVQVVLKVDWHCLGCAKKVVKSVRSFHGVELVKIVDMELKKIMVVGEVDPVELRWRVEEKFNNKVELISPAKEKVKFAENDDQFRGGMRDEIKFPETTMVLKVSLDCEGCIQSIQQLIKKTKGFKEMSIDTRNDLVTVKGAIEVNALAEVIEEKLNRKVEIVPQKKKKNSGSGGEKGGGVGGEGKESGGRMVEHKMENVYVGQRQGQYMYPPYVNGPNYMYNYMHATQMFDEENPNACVIM